MLSLSSSSLQLTNQPSHALPNLCYQVPISTGSILDYTQDLSVLCGLHIINFFDSPQTTLLLRVL